MTELIEVLVCEDKDKYVVDSCMLCCCVTLACFILVSSVNFPAMDVWLYLQYQAHIPFCEACFESNQRAAGYTRPLVSLVHECVYPACQVSNIVHRVQSW